MAANAHSYEEIRDATLRALISQEKLSTQYGYNHGSSQYQTLRNSTGQLLPGSKTTRQPWEGDPMDGSDGEAFLEVFWSLFREGIITLGLNDSNREFPFYRVTQFGKKVLAGQNPYFFYDLSSYEGIIRDQIPDIDEVTLVYLMEGMQAFRSGCLLSATVMIGVATEHTFLRLIETIEGNATHGPIYAAVSKERTILQKVNKFQNILGQNIKPLPSEVKEDLDTHFAAILSMIRNYRNQAGHPTGKILNRETVYMLLQLFVPYCRKMYQLITHFK